MFESAEIGHKLGKTEFKKRGAEAAPAAARRAVRSSLEQGQVPGPDPRERRRRRRQGRDGEPLQRVDGPAPHPHPRLRRRAPTSSATAPRDVALLAGAAAQGPHRHPLRLLVHRSRSWTACWAHDRRAEFERRLSRIRHFERMLVAEGALLIKLWFHLSKKAQKQAPRRSSPRDKQHRVARDDARTGSASSATTSSCDVCEDALRETSTGEAPWT